MSTEVIKKIIQKEQYVTVFKNTIENTPEFSQVFGVRHRLYTSASYGNFVPELLKIVKRDFPDLDTHRKITDIIDVCLYSGDRIKGHIGIEFNYPSCHADYPTVSPERTYGTISLGTYEKNPKQLTDLMYT